MSAPRVLEKKGGMMTIEIERNEAEPAIFPLAPFQDGSCNFLAELLYERAFRKTPHVRYGLESGVFREDGVCVKVPGRECETIEVSVSRARIAISGAAKVAFGRVVREKGEKR